MGLITKTFPKGIDKMVDKLQRSFWSSLSSKFTSWDSYPRCNLNPRGSSLIPEYISDVSKDYTEVYINDRVDLTTFFLSKGDRALNEGSGKYEAKFDMYVQCSNLKALFPSVTHRADEELIVEFSNAFKNKVPMNVNLNLVVTELEDVYRGMDTSKIKFSNMNEYCVFKMEFTTLYKFDLICN